MCGICGYITKNNIPPNYLVAMNDTLAHRGPDDKGIYQNTVGDFSLGLAHRRLSIMDLSSAGHQPMFTADGKICIVFNGEIYNFPLLQKELSQKGHRFHSHCDTEVILESYLEWGMDCVHHFNGMFAFCLVDLRNDNVYFARDRVGKKPLYYYLNGETLVFGSELKALMAFPGFPKTIRTDVLSRYLYHGYIAAPDTIFENTYKLMAGHTMTWHGGKLRTDCFWNVVTKRAELDKNKLHYPDIKEELRTILTDAVEKRMLSDVPLGTFLSGGIDSTLVTALAQKVSTSAIKTYSIGFENPKYDEAPFAREIATHLNTDHHEMYVKEEAFLEAMDNLPQYYDEPFADSSQIPTMLVSQFAKKDVTVVLSGDGGDELFCGYSTYDHVKQAGQLQRIANILSLLTRTTNSEVKTCMPRKVKSLLSILEHPFAECQLVTGEQERLVNSLPLSSDQLPVWYRREINIHEKNWQIRRMLLDVQTYMSDDILVKVDRASMRYSLEARCPLLDHRVIEYAFSLPHTYSYKKGEKKWILKDILYDYVPKALLDRPKKGFAIPVGHYLRTVKQDLLGGIKDESMLSEQGIFQPKAIADLIHTFLNGDNRQEALVWKYCMFQQWYDRYVK